MNRGPIHLHIDELVLEGFEPSQRHQIADAVQQELARLLEEDLSADCATSLRRARADAGEFVVADRNAFAVGRGVARAVGATVSEMLNASGHSAVKGRVG